MLDLHRWRNSLLRVLIADILPRDRQLSIIRLTLQIRHVHLLRLLLIHKDIRLRKPDAILMDIDFYIEMRDKDVKEGGLVDIGVETLCGVGEDENRPEEIDEDCVHDGYAVETGLDAVGAIAQQPKELHDQLFELHVIEDTRIIGLIKQKAKVRIIDDILNLPDVLLVIAILSLEAQLQILIVEDSDVGLHIVLEELDYSSGLDQVVIEEGG